MLANMQPPPSAPSAQAGGHGPFSDADIQQIMVETGFSYQQVCQAIDSTGAQTKEQLFPNVYEGTGIQPQQPSAEGQETMGPGAVQAQPGAPPPMAPAEANEGGMPTPTQSAPVEGISPEVAQAVHTAMAPKSKYKRMSPA